MRGLSIRFGLFLRRIRPTTCRVSNVQVRGASSWTYFFFVVTLPLQPVGATTGDVGHVRRVDAGACGTSQRLAVGAGALSAAC